VNKYGDIRIFDRASSGDRTITFSETEEQKRCECCDQLLPVPTMQAEGKRLADFFCAFVNGGTVRAMVAELKKRGLSD
jgi:hypothetical protein